MFREFRSCGPAQSSRRSCESRRAGRATGLSRRPGAVEQGGALRVAHLSRIAHQWSRSHSSLARSARSGGAIAVIALRNPFYSVLALVVHLFSLAGLFLILHAEFVAAAQVVVYAGAVMVLYVFVAAYVGGFEEPLWDAIPGQRILAPLLAGALFIELSIAVLGSALESLGTEGATIPDGFGSPEAIGRLLLERFLIPFEVASLLLLIAAVGAVVLAGRRPEAEGPADRQEPA